MSARGEYGKRFYSASYLQVAVQIIIIHVQAMQHNYYMFVQMKGIMRLSNEDHRELTQVGEA